MNRITYQRKPRSQQAEIQRNLRSLFGDKDPSSIRKLRKRVEAKGFEGNDVTAAMFFERTKPFPDAVYERNEPLSTPKPNESIISRLQALNSISEAVLSNLQPENYPFISWLMSRQHSLCRIAVLLVINHKLKAQFETLGIEPTSLQKRFLKEFTTEVLKEKQNRRKQNQNG